MNMEGKAMEDLALDCSATEKRRFGHRGGGRCYQI
jgi:hypothetical protein